MFFTCFVSPRRPSCSCGHRFSELIQWIYPIRLEQLKTFRTFLTPDFELLISHVALFLCWFFHLLPPSHENPGPLFVFLSAVCSLFPFSLSVAHYGSPESLQSISTRGFYVSGSRLSGRGRQSRPVTSAQRILRLQNSKCNERMQRCWREDGEDATRQR